MIKETWSHYKWRLYRNMPYLLIAGGASFHSIGLGLSILGGLLLYDRQMMQQVSFSDVEEIFDYKFQEAFKALVHQEGDFPDFEGPVEGFNEYDPNNFPPFTDGDGISPSDDGFPPNFSDN